ncbi:MAG: metallophosphoesterase [Clostridia bacterium]|nr:metallophosphoesterase [Clostridia bacterium]
MNTELLGNIMAAGCLLLAAAGMTCTKPIVRRTRAAADKVSRPVKIAQISDLHDSFYKKNQVGLLSLLERENPDLIVFTGDIVDDTERAKNAGQGSPILYEGHPARLLMEGCVKLAPCYMVFGNHERAIPDTERLSAEIEAIGVTLLRWQDAEVCGIRLCGADDPYFLAELRPDPYSISQRMQDDRTHESPTLTEWREKVAAFAPAKDGRFTVLLSHRPEEWKHYRDCGFDAALSGHAHGGQVRIPLLLNGLYAPHQGLFPSHAGGCYRYDGFVHVVSRGLSKKRAPRVFNRPEICVLTVEPS